MQAAELDGVSFYDSASTPTPKGFGPHPHLPPRTHAGIF